MRACKSWCKRPVAGALAVCVLALGASAYGQEIQWIPVSSTGPATISGNEITISVGGVRVGFDVFISGWGSAPGAPDLGAFQATAVGSDMLGANASPPNPGVDLSHQPQVPCFSAADCATGKCGSFRPGFCDDNEPGFQFSKHCLDDSTEPCTGTGTNCAGTPVCIGNSAFVVFNCAPNTAVALPASGNYEFIAACDAAPVVDVGQVGYAASINFEVPPNAKGTYTITFNSSNERTLLNDGNGVLIPGLVKTPGLLTIETGRCCFALGKPNAGCVSGVRTDECDREESPRLFEANVDCPNSGGPDCPECITTQVGACRDPTACQNGNDNLCTSNDCTPFLPGSLGGTCSNSPLFDETVHCCDPDTGTTVNIDDFDECTADSCVSCTGAVIHDPAGALGRDCDDGLGCTINDACDGVNSQANGGCVGDVFCPHFDCDGDGVLDSFETDPAEQDCDNNGICNGVEIASCPESDRLCADCNVNGVPDACDIDEEFSTDVNNNNVPDECDRPCCSNGDCVLLLPTDCLAVGGTVVPACLGVGGNSVDDACELDCDGDGTIDIDEMNTADQDCDLNGICNGEEIASCLGGDPFCADCNKNGIPDACDLALLTSTDCNNNDLPDQCEIAVGSIGPGGPFFCTANCEPDCNNTGLPDSCDIARRTSADCTGDGIPDECNIADGTSDVCNNNGIPDECEAWACCVDSDDNSFFDACGMFTEAICLKQIGGEFRGPCHECPEQTSAVILESGGDVFIHRIESPVDCLAETESRAAARGGCGPGVPKIDPWTSNSDAQMCQNFGVPGSPAIPADFFNPGSDPFVGLVCLVGTPLGKTPFGDFGEADTLISRTDDPIGRCSLVFNSPSSVDLEVVALSLVDDSDPVIVTFNGGQNPEPWTVAVDLSTVAAPAGSLITATKTHCNGGTYTSVLNVQPRFTFTKVSDPGMVRVLDTGLAGRLHISLTQNQSAPWVHDIDPNLGLTFDPCSSFHPGVEDTLQTVDCDCDGNSNRDKCDIETLASPDCNLNTVPDSCDLIANTSQDCNENNVPDECELSAPAVPAAPPDNIHKNRFVSLVPNNPACVAIRVELLDLRCSSTGKKCSSDAECKICDAGGKVGEACSRNNECPDGICVISGETCDEQSLPIQLGWVDDPFVPDGDRIEPETFGARVVQDMPATRRWVEPVVHVGDCEIAPAQTYGFSATADGVTFSPRLVLGTTPKPQDKFWGDCVGKFTGTEWTAPNGFVDVNDIQAMIKFLVISNAAPHMARVDLGGEAPNWLINASDLQLVIRAFLAFTYPPVPFPNQGGPADCP